MASDGAAGDSVSIDWGGVFSSIMPGVSDLRERPSLPALLNGEPR